MRLGSMTAFLFGASDCTCSPGGEVPKAAQSAWAGLDVDDGDFCPKCGLQIVTASRDGSLTGFLFQSTRCKCVPDQAFADGAMSSKFWKLKQAGGGTIFITAGGEFTPASGRASGGASAGSVGLASGAIISR
jgi:hypothetical protein